MKTAAPWTRHRLGGRVATFKTENAADNRARREALADYRVCYEGGRWVIKVRN